jgi:hypothetical protein
VRGQMVMSAHRKSAHPQASDHLEHATINPISENSALPKMHEASPTPVTFAEAALGHDFSRVPLHAEVPVQRTSSCSLSPTRCPFGGACHTCSVPVQTKLKIGQPDDKYEREADRIADMVMSMPEPRVQRQVGPEAEEEDETVQTKPLTAQITPLLQRQVEPEEEEEEQLAQAKSEGGAWLQRQEQEPEEEEEETIQAKSARGQVPQADPGLQAQIRSLRGGGRPLPPSVRSFFEPWFGRDFSQVRVHTDAKAAESARAVNSRAYTVDQDIVFGAGQYALGTSQGQQLLAHELTHTVQQSNSYPARNRLMRAPTESKIKERPPRYSYSTHCGWIDWGHVKADLSRDLIGRVREASLRMARREQRLGALVKADAPKLVTEDRCSGRYEANEAADSRTEPPNIKSTELPSGVVEVRVGGFQVGSADTTKFRAHMVALVSSHRAWETLRGTKFAIEVAGFTDCVGLERRNSALRQDRQDAIRQFFLGPGQVATPTAFGINRYLSSNSTRAGRRDNRGVLIRFIPRAKPERFKTKTMESRVPVIGGISYARPISGVTPTVEISRSLTPEEILRVSLSILMIQSQLFETLQYWTDWLAGSAFAEEDLPSNLISFYSAARGYKRPDIERICDSWDKTRSLGAFRGYTFQKNRTFRPPRYPPGGSWPAELNTISPATPGGPLWSFIAAILETPVRTIKCRQTVGGLQCR